MQICARFAAVVVLSSAVALPAASQDADTVLARVGQTEITLGHAIAMRQSLPQQFRAVPDAALFPAVVEQLIEQELIAQALADRLTRSERITLENDRRAFVANAALMSEARAAVTDASIATAYDAFASEFAAGDPVTEYNAAHILVRTREEIDSVVAELAGGRDFAEVAAQYSLDGSAQQGGDLGWFGPGVMIQPFEDAVVALEPGQVSDPVETRFGWHVVLLKETRLAEVPALDDIRAELVGQIQREAARALVESLRGTLQVENLAEGVDPDLLSRVDLLEN